MLREGVLFFLKRADLLMNKVINVARIATVPFFLDHQLRQQMEDLLGRGFNVSAITSSSGNWDKLQKVDNLRCIKLDISRDPSPLNDLVSLCKLYFLFKKKGFDIIHSTTPKAGLLCALAGWLARTPIRLHTFTGQTWNTKTGVKKWLLRFIDKGIVWLNTQCYADSESQVDYLIKEGVGNKTSIKVLGKGSLAGVNLKRFDCQRWQKEISTIQTKLGINKDDFVLVFIGRLGTEKGIFELMEAFELLSKKYANLHLLLIGPCEELIVEKKLEEWCLLPGLHHIGSTDTPEKYLSITHLLCLPSYREGFGTVVIEAAAMKIPTLGTNITGLCDAVDDKITGLLVKPKDAQEYTAALDRLIEDKIFCELLGLQAFERCKQYFDSSSISDLVAKEYTELFESL